MLEALIIILLILWLAGFSFHVAGGLVHLLLIVVLVLVALRIAGVRIG